jgi:hypothetical protein
MPKLGSKSILTDYFHAVNSATVTLHPVVPNLYIFLGLIPAEAKFFTGLSISTWSHRASPSLPSNGKVLVLEKRDNQLGLGCHKASKTPTIFGTALASTLKAFLANQHGCILLQYVNGLLLAVPTQEDCMEGTQLLLSLLWKAVYKVSQKKAQICQDTINYLGFHLSQGQSRLGPERKHAVCSILTPKNCQQITEFLGAADFCWI